MPAAFLNKNRLRLPTSDEAITAVLHLWPLAFPWLAFAGGVTALWHGGWRGEAGWLIPLGIAALVAAGTRGLPWALVLLGIPVGTFRYLLFCIPPMAGTGTPLAKGFTLVIGAAIWESAPLLVAVALGAHLLNRKAPMWVLFLVVAGFFTGLSVWLPRPYGFSFAAPLVYEMPGPIWALGADLTGGVLLGFLFVVMVWVSRPVRPLVMAAWSGGLLLVLLGSHLAYLNWQGQCSGINRKVVEHDTLAIPGNLPPFISNYRTMSDRALYPMILFSAMRPDLIMGPENLIQANQEVDPDNDAGTLQRHITSIGTCIAVPFSQSLFGVRDHHTARIYFSDLVNGKPRVQWKDLARRIPGVDLTVPKIQDFFTKAYHPSILAPKSLPLMDLWKHETNPDEAYHEDEVKGLRRISRAVICMSGEIREPLLVRRVVQDKTITAVMNPNICGWLGPQEAVGASIQARARLLELGLIGYRVGQTDGTELVVPWLTDSLPSVVAPNKAFVRFKAPLPYERAETGYTMGLWRVSIFLIPVAGVLTLLLWFGRSIPQIRHLFRDDA
jgi:hypothetical protein